MGFLELFVVALTPVLETLLVAGVGVLLALKKFNILSPISRHNLNDLVFYVFIPAYVASSLVETITLSGLIELWFMPVNVLLTFIIGSALGWILVKITRAPQHLHGLIISCCSAGNLGNLPIIIIPAVCKEANSPFGDSHSCAAKGLAYASLPMAIGFAFMWIYAYNILRVEAEAMRKQEKSSLEEGLLCKEKLQQNDEIHRAQAAPILIDSTEDRNKVPIVEIEKRKQNWSRLVEKWNLDKVFTPTTIATIVGLIIGAIAPLRRLIIGANAPLRVLDNAASLLGQAAVPAMTLILGANLVQGLKKSGLGVSSIIGLQVVRFIAMPLLGILVVKGANHVGLVGSDSLYQFVLMLHYAVPPAMAIGTMTELIGVGESDCSVIMLWTYAVASLAVTVWSTFYMWLLSRS